MTRAFEIYYLQIFVYVQSDEIYSKFGLEFGDILYLGTWKSYS